MRTIFLTAILAIVALIGHGNAQNVPNNDTVAVTEAGPADEELPDGGELPVTCGGSYSSGFMTGRVIECTFRCRAGDYIYVEGSISRYDQLARFRASCENAEVAATCYSDGEYGPPSCVGESDNPWANTAVGRCTVENLFFPLLASGTYRCTSVPPPE